MGVLVVNKRRGARIGRVRLRKVAREVMAAEGCDHDAELSVAIGDDKWIQDLNQRYKGSDSPTDVLAFAQDISPAGAGRLLGDVAISVETAERQAREAGHGTAEELDLLLTHGILHLTGWTDETPAQRRRMMRRAQELLSRLEASTPRRSPREGIPLTHSREPRAR